MTKNYQFMQPYRFANGAELKNRIVMAPVTTMSSYFDGTVTNDEIEFYRMRSGVGMIIAEVANVDPDGKGFEGELSIVDDRFIPGLTRLAGAIKTNGSKAIMQIFDAGRKTTRAILRGHQPHSASAVAPHRDPENVPHALTEEEVETLIKNFGDATRRAIKAGFDGVEIHGANTYLIQQFFSPHSNRRTDKWGGDVEKRMNFAKAIIKEVRRVADEEAPKDFIIGYRFSPEELSEPGITMEDTLKLVDMLSEQPIDYLHSSMGNRKRTSLRNPDDHELINDQLLKQINGRKPLIQVGNVQTPADAEEAINDGAALVAMGRELLREPNWVEKVAAGDEKSIRYELSPIDMDLVGLPGGLQRELRTGFLDVMNFTDQMTDKKQFGKVEAL